MNSYKNAINNFNKEYYSSLLMFYFRLYNYIDDDGNVWNFQWNGTKCINYDPYKSVYDISKPKGSRGCSEKFICKQKVPLNKKKVYSAYHHGIQ